MIFYLVDIVHAFAPAAVVSGLVVALLADQVTRRTVIAGVWAVAAALVIGWAAHAFAPGYRAGADLTIALRVIALAAVALGLATAALHRIGVGAAGTAAPGAVIALSASLAVQAMVDFLARSVDQSLSATTILNTELFANIFAIAVGTAAVSALVVLVAQIGRRAGAASLAVLAIVAALLAVSWTAEILLGLLQIGVLGVTAGRVAFVAKVTEASALMVYAQLGLVFLLALVAVRRPTRSSPDRPSVSPRVLRRLQAAVALAERRWLRATVAVASFLVVALLYHDLYASLPPSLSAAEPVTPDDSGVIQIPVEAVKDGNLHRFAYIASDGHRVRFFLINRYDQDHVRIGVVYDACMICGDEGYIQQGNEVICIACNVRVFIPSIGKPGGCNPIPLAHELRDGQIVIAASELERGSRYFSEVVAVEVKDPVTGERLVNLDAPFQYDYMGKTFFFGTRESYEKFRGSPEDYATGTLSRYFRVQGYQGHGS